jgi:hypothetical protein
VPEAQVSALRKAAARQLSGGLPGECGMSGTRTAAARPAGRFVAENRL